MNIAVFTIIYNNYGQFFKTWYECVMNQTIKPSEIICVLGKDHGVENIEDYEDVRFISVDSNIMGTLRNKGLKNSTSEWLLYFSVDDILLPNALEEIKKHSDKDVVCLRYKDIRVNCKALDSKSAMFSKRDIKNWRNNAVPGYIAYKRVINDIEVTYEDIEIPNYPFLFLLASINATYIDTDNICAEYKRRLKGHGHTSGANGRWKKFRDYIDKSASRYSK